MRGWIVKGITSEVGRDAADICRVDPNHWPGNFDRSANDATDLLPRKIDKADINSILTARTCLILTLVFSVTGRKSTAVVEGVAPIARNCSALVPCTVHLRLKQLQIQIKLMHKLPHDYLKWKNVCSGLQFFGAPVEGFDTHKATMYRPLTSCDVALLYFHTS